MEFLLVGLLLTVLTLGVLQVGLAIYVRNVVHDAAVEGAFHAALADTSLAQGADRARTIIEKTIGADYADGVSVTSAAPKEVLVRVVAPLPVIGLLGLPESVEVTARAPVEILD